MDNYKEIVNENIYKMCADFLSCKIPFTILIDNHNNWNNSLPARLSSKKKFLLNIKDQALEDSYVENGKIIIITTMEDMEFMKELDHNDISAVAKDDKTAPFISKPFVTYPKIISKGKLGYKLDEEQLLKSTLNFKKHNPKMFKAPNE